LFTFHGQRIRSLDDIPADCQLLIVSEQPPPEEKAEEDAEQAKTGNKRSRSRSKSKKSRKPVEPSIPGPEPRLVGLKNNIYDFKTEQAETRHKIKRVEESIFTKKKEWINKNTQDWYDSTPFIYDYHKEMDHKLHMVRPNQTFVAVKRAQ